MGKKTLKIPSIDSHRLNMQTVRGKNDTMIANEFFLLHEKFIQDKVLEGLASTTINGHKENFKYFKKYINEEYQSGADCIAIDSEVLKGYVYYMLQEKQFKPCTINVRLRTLRCYLKWLYDEEYLNYNYAMKLKLVRVPEDTIKPLSDKDVKKMLNATDKTSYSGYRDYVMMVLMLDCGVRVGEAVNIKVEDVDLKAGLINIKGENAKTRVFRQLPISPKTCRLLSDLLAIAEENNCEYVFQSTYGGKIKKQNIILSFARLGEKVGLKVRCTPHIYRHTFATNAVKGGIDPFTLQRILGHTTMAMTRKYVQLESSDLVNKHSKIDLLNKYLR